MAETQMTEEEKVIEMWTAYKEKGFEGIKEVGRKRNAEWRAELEKNREQGAAGNSSEIQEKSNP